MISGSTLLTWMIQFLRRLLFIRTVSEVYISGVLVRRPHTPEHASFSGQFFNNFFLLVRLPLHSEAVHMFSDSHQFPATIYIFGDWTIIFQILALYFLFIYFLGEVLI